MPDLGDFAFAVLASYAVALGLLAGLIGLTLWQSARMARALAAAEARAAEAAKAKAGTKAP